MIRTAWQGLSPFVEHPRRMAALLAVVSVFVGLAEGGVLVIVVQTALAIAESGRSGLTRLPVVHVSLSSGQLLWIAAGLGLLSIVGHFFQARLKARVMSDVSANARSLAIDAFLGASWNRQAQDREGALQETMSSLVGRLSAMAGCLVLGTASVINLGAFLVLAAFVNPVAMSLVVLLGGVLSMVMRPLSRLTQRRSGEYIEINSRFVEEISRATSLAMDYRVFGVEDAASAELHGLIHQTARRQYVSRVSGSFYETLYRDLAALFLVTALAGMYLVKDVEVVSIGTVVVLIVRGLAYSTIVQIQFQTLNEEIPGLDAFQLRVGELGADVKEFGTTPISQIDSLEFDNVDYEYVSGLPALKSVSLRLEPGEVLGVVGPSGGGKSTFVQVLLRLRPPDHGNVMINGQPYECFDQGDWASLATLVPQEPRLMEASILDNISFLRPGISSERIEEAAEDAHVADDIRKLTNGFNTLLGARGLGLSGGQKQRVAIARALVGRPKLLVLDEPTSALDMNSERLLQATIEKLKGSVTMVIVAHRLSTLDVCDRLLVLRDGRVEAIGTPAELKSQPGFYQSVTSDLEAPAEQPLSVEQTA